MSAAWADPHWAETLGGRFAVGYRALREGDRLLIRSESGDTRLLDVHAAPVEVDEPDTLAAMEARLLAASPSLAEATSERRTVSDEMRQQLIELGYVE